MNLELSNKSPHIASLLVNLYDNHKLYSMVDNKDKPKAQRDVTQAVTELFEADLGIHDQEIISDVLIGLMRQAEIDMRQAIADKLAGMDKAPLRLILHLANDTIDVASPVLERSPVLSDMDLVYIIKSQGSEYWQAIASREQLSDNIVDALADTHDVGTAVILSENDRITLTRHAMEILSDIAINHESVSGPLLKRKELPPEFSERIYRHVTHQVQSHIEIEFEDPAPEIDMVMEEVMHEHAPKRLEGEFMPDDYVIHDALQDRQRGLLNKNKMLMSLQNGRIDTFIAEFSVYTGLSVRRIHDFILQTCPKGLAIACKAFGMTHDEFARVYLLTHRARSATGVVNQSKMIKMLDYFDGLNPELSKRIAWRSVVDKSKRI